MNLRFGSGLAHRRQTLDAFSISLWPPASGLERLSNFREVAELRQVTFSHEKAT